MNEAEINARRAANSAMSLGGDAARRALDAAAGLLSFDELAYTPPRLHVLWLENSLDCRTWCALRPPLPLPPQHACTHCSLAARRAIAGRTTATSGRRWAGYTSSARRAAG